MTSPVDWQSIANDWEYAYGKPEATGKIKVEPADFKVIEYLGFEPSGQGEHVWLHVSKVKQNTDKVAKALARFSNVAYKDVSYSGLKDFFAETDQWFSIWLPKQGTLDSLSDWSDCKMQGVTINRIERHAKKLRRGSHRSNQFRLVIRDFEGDYSQFQERCSLIVKSGVPNYFGAQRFGRDFSNMSQARRMLVDQEVVASRNLRSMLFSAARSWIFNCIVSKRLEQGTWSSLYPFEPANLNATNSVFISDESEELTDRLELLDVHPTAPLVGQKNDTNLLEVEQSVIDLYDDLHQGLLESGLSYTRRPIRLKVTSLNVDKIDSGILLEFELQRGQFATSVLRELIDTSH